MMKCAFGKAKNIEDLTREELVEAVRQLGAAMGRIQASSQMQSRLFVKVIQARNAYVTRKYGAAVMGGIQ